MIAIPKMKKVSKSRSNKHSSNFFNFFTGIHFNEKGHQHKDFEFHIIEKVIPNTPHMRLQRENYWIQTLNTKTPRGLNKNTI